MNKNSPPLAQSSRPSAPPNRRPESHRTPQTQPPLFRPLFRPQNLQHPINPRFPSPIRKSQRRLKKCHPHRLPTPKPHSAPKLQTIAQHPNLFLCPYTPLQTRAAMRPTLNITPANARSAAILTAKPSKSSSSIGTVRETSPRNSTAALVSIGHPSTATRAPWDSTPSVPGISAQSSTSSSKTLPPSLPLHTALLRSSVLTPP